MRHVKVCGEVYQTHPLRESDLRPDTLLYGKTFRCAYRIVCEDQGDYILRNLRCPHILEARKDAQILELYERISLAAESV